MRILKNRILKNNVLKDNSGSAVIETTLVIPVVFAVVVMVIYLFFDVLNDGYTQGYGYSQIYSYRYDGHVKEAYDKKGYAFVDSGDMDTFIGEKSKAAEKNLLMAKSWVYSYEDLGVTYCTEYDLCTDRLRRWQLYGDTLQ